jgi:hypothetical protein
MRRPLTSLSLALFAACAAPEPREEARPPAAPIPAAAPAPTPGPGAARTELEAFARPHDWPDGEAWIAVGLPQSQVTGSARRLWFHKDAVTAALVAHAGGFGFDAAPLVYPPGTVFFAEQLGADGAPFDTEVLVTRDGETPDFLLFDAAGARERAEVPSSCIACHAGDGFFQPMMSFPNEPPAQRLALGDEWRDVDIARRFLEGYHRGDRVFGPYASMWFSKLRADARAGALSEADRARLERLRARYADLLD